MPIGEHTFTVETETRAADHPLIDTTVYAQGRVMYRRVKSYQDLLGESGGEAEVEALREQSPCNIAASSMICAPVFCGLSCLPRRCRRRCRLLAAASNFRRALRCVCSTRLHGLPRERRLEIEVRGRATLLPAVGTAVEVLFEGCDPQISMRAGTDPRGRVALTFPLPKLGPDGGQLVIGRRPGWQDELRYRLKPKLRQPDTGKAQTK